MSDHQDVDDYIARNIESFRAPTRKVTTFGFGRRSRTVRPGELVLYAPNGTPFRVIEDPRGGTQIEQDDHLHAVIRPPTVNVSTKANQPKGSRR